MTTWGNGYPIPKRVRQQVLARDRTCRLAYPGCTIAIDDIDHITNLATLGISRRNPASWRLDNLQGVCRRCHNRKTQAESTRTRMAYKRQPERHPGLA